ncbi:MAG: DUF6197 family protein [Mycobacterium sp.]
MTHTDQIADVLLIARNRLAAGQWCKGTLRDDHGNVCMYGALSEAMSRHGRLDSHDVTKLLIPHMWCCSMAAFNDAPSTTLADVLTVFDKALAELGRTHEVHRCLSNG